MKQPRKESRSDVQQEVEQYCIAEIEKKIGIKDLKNKQVLYFGSQYPGTKIMPDIYSEKQMIIGEVHAHIGKLKSAQVDKVAADILKMIAFEENLGRTMRKIIVVCDDEEEKSLRGNSYVACAIKLYEVEVYNVALNSDLRERLTNAMKRQNFYAKSR